MIKSGWSIFFGACAVIFLVPIIILLIYSHSLTGDFLPFGDGVFSSLSNMSSSWGEFGSLLSGLFGLSSALATMITLWFVIHQSQKSIARSDMKDDELAAEKKEYVKFLDEHNKKVVDFHNDVMRFNSSVSEFQFKVIDFNENQKIRDNFEKFKLHKEMFNELIDNIETDLQMFYQNNEIRVLKKHELYSAIFPLNSFTSSTSDSTQDFSDNNTKFNSIQIFLNGIYGWVTNQEHYAVKGVLRSYSGLLSELNIHMPFNAAELGCVYEEVKGENLFNIKRFKEEIAFILSICNRLVSFSGNSDFKTPPENYDFLILESRLINIGQSLSSIDDNGENYRSIGCGYSHGSASLFHVYAKIKLSGMDSSPEIRMMIAYLRNLLSRVKHGISERDKIDSLDFLNDLKLTLEEMLKEEHLDINNEFSPGGFLLAAHRHLCETITEYT